MKEHLRLGRVAGIPIGANASVLVIAALLAWSLASAALPSLVPGQSATAYWATAVGVTLAFFASLLAHELAHAIVARRHGIRVERITLWLLGGVSRLSADVPRPQDELPMAAAGPATSLAVGVVGLATANLTALLGLPALLVHGVAWLAAVNLVLGLFNLAPAFPLDGGHILRALLWRRHGDRLRATATAARWGTGFGYALFGLGGFSLIQGSPLNGLWFWLLGMFVLDAARSELRNTAEHDLLGDLRVGDLMTPDPVSVPPELTLTQLIDRYVLAARHSAYPVVDHGRPIGLISLTELRAVPPAARPTTLVAQAARPLADVPTAHAGEPLTDLIDRLNATGASRALVVDDGRLAGVLSLTDVARALNVRAAARGVPVG